MNKLDEIIAHKRQEIRPLLAREEKLRLGALSRNDFRSLENALTRAPEHLSLIAEIKKASPSAGVIRGEIDPVEQGMAYELAGADAISVLTDLRYFGGQLADMTRVRQAVNIPVLRKEFIVHRAQIYESAVAGADAILLIVAALKQEELLELLEIAQTCQLEVLVEVHNLEELERALETDARLIGINNRNLQTFKVDLGTTEELAEEVGDDLVLISESGIKTMGDAHRAAQAGADALLVGETLMRAESIEECVRGLKQPRLARVSDS